MEDSEIPLAKNVVPSAEPKQNTERPELIKAACVSWNGEEYYGESHSAAWEQVYEKYGSPLPTEHGKEGYKTTRGNFVDRYKAFAIARDGGQLTEKAAREKTGKFDALLSGDVRFELAL